jgi:hypothetical protein
MFERYRFAVICLLASCIPPAGRPPAQPPLDAYPGDWLTEPTAPPVAYFDEGDPAADFLAAGRRRDRARGNPPVPRSVIAPDRSVQRGALATRFRCTAQGTLGTAYGDRPWQYSTETASGSGPTKAAAGFKALEDCTAMMSRAAALAMSSGQRRDGGTCEVVDCRSQPR